MVSAEFIVTSPHNNPIPGKNQSNLNNNRRVENRTIKSFSNTFLPPFTLDDNSVYLVQVKFQSHCELLGGMRN